MENFIIYKLEILFLCTYLFQKPSLGILIERVSTGDIIHSVTSEKCDNFSSKANWNSSICQCATHETFYNINKQEPKCYKGTGTNVGCTLAFKGTSSQVLTFTDSRNDYPGTILGDLVIPKGCGYSIEEWTLKGWKVNRNITAKYAAKSVKRKSGLFIAWLDLDFKDHLAGKLFRYKVLPGCAQNCVLFKAQGVEKAPPTIPPTFPPTTPPTKTYSTPILLNKTTQTFIRDSSLSENSSATLSILLGITLFILVVIICGIIIFIWFKKRHGNKRFIFNLFQPKKTKGKENAALDTGDNIYEDIAGRKPELPKRNPPFSIKKHENLYLTPAKDDDTCAEPPATEDYTALDHNTKRSLATTGSGNSNNMDYREEQLPEIPSSSYITLDCLQEEQSTYCALNNDNDISPIYNDARYTSDPTSPYYYETEKLDFENSKSMKI